MNTKRPTRKLICNALLDLLEEKPLDEITITELAKRAGVSRASFYRNFENIYDVLQTLEDDFFANLPSEHENTATLINGMELGKGDGPHPNTNILASLSGVMDASMFMRTYSVLTGPNGDPSFERRMLERMRRSTRKALALRLGDTGPEIDLMTEFLVASQVRSMHWLAKHQNELDMEQAIRFILAMYMNASRAIIDTQYRLNIDIRTQEKA